MSNKCKVGVFGVGHLGSIHARLAKEIDIADLTGVYDLDAVKASQVGQNLDVPAYDDISKLLEQVEVAIISASTRAHYDLAMQAVNAGVHVFIEKPLADTPERAREVQDKCASANLKLGVGHIERFNRAVRSLEGITIDPRFIEAHRLAAFTLRGADVAVIHDLMIHDLDLILHWVKSPVKKLDASGVAVISDAPDIATAGIALENGCVANVTASRSSSKKMRKMRLFQEDSYISLDFTEGKTDIYRLAEPDETGIPALELGQIEKGSKPKKILYQQPVAPEANALKMEVEFFLKAVLLNQPVPVSGEDGVRALELAEEILKQIDT